MAPTNRKESGKKEPRINIALFDSSTLVGKGVKTHLVHRKFPSGEVRLFETGAIEEGGNVAEFNGEARLAVRPALAEMEGVDLAFFCGDRDTARNYLGWPGRGRFVAIDLSGSANDQGGIPVVNASVNPGKVQSHRGVLATPHPVAQILTSFLAALRNKLHITGVVALVMQPVSEAGERGIQELHQQTVGLLNGQEVEKDLFGRVLAFNLVPISLAPQGSHLEEIVTRETLGILGEPRFSFSHRIFLVPVFHCHGFTARVEFQEEVSPEGVRQALAGDSSIRIREDAEGATPAELAGEEKIVLGEIRADSSNRRALWFWGVADNLTTGTALNAVRLAETLFGVPSEKRPS